MRLFTLWRPLALLCLLAGSAQAQNYAQTTITPGFFNIATLAPTTITSGDDANSAAISFPAGFTFSYFGTNRTSYRANTNGFLSFAATAPTNGTYNPTDGVQPTFPRAAVPNDIVAPLWDDLVMGGTGGGVRAYLDDRGTPADATDDRYIIQWNGYFFGGTTQTLVFQVQLYATGVIEYHYQTVSTAQTDYSVGLENGAGTLGVDTYSNTAGSSTTPGVGTPAAAGTAFRYTSVVQTAPVFALSPTTAQTLGTAGACSSTTTLTSVFTVTNSGVGTLNVTSAALAGGTGFTVNTAGLPAALTSGQSVTVPVTFAPAAGQTGATSTQLTVSYNDGTAQTSAPVTINATATNASAAFASGSGGTTPAGVAYRNSQTNGCNAGSALPAPSAAVVDFTGHTRIDAGFVASGTSFPALDSGSYAVTEAALDALLGGRDFTFFGRRIQNFWINSNTNVTMGSAQGGFTGGLPSSTGGGSVQAGAMDVSLSTVAQGTNVNYAADNAGVVGAPGVFLGTSDVNGDDLPDLVVTWYHAYDYQSVVYDGTPGSASHYFTSQIIILSGTRANEDSRIEMRFPSGNDANGVPWRLGTAGSFVENDVVTGLTNQQGTASAEYREDTVGGPMYDGAASLGVAFAAETQATATAGAGWRLMGAPVTGYTVGRLADLNLVQSVTGQYPDFLGDNVLVTYDNVAGTYSPAGAVADALTAGRGFFWYLFDQDVTPPQANSGGGTSVSYVLPMALQGTGQTPSGTVNVALATAGNGTDNVFTMAANPYRTGLNASTANVATWANGGTNALASNVVQYYDTAAGTYLAASLAPTPNVLSAWTGFFVENAPAAGRTTLAVPVAAQAAGGTFPGRAADGAGLVAFELSGTTAGGVPTLDRAATLVFDADATAAWDGLDASKLAPPLAAYATLGFQGTGILGAETVKAQESRPLAGDAFDVPLVVDAVGTAPALTLTWPTVAGVPETMALELRDLVTGTVIDLRAQTSYTFEVQAGSALAGSPEALLARTTTAAQAKAGAAPRFVLHVATRGATANEGDAVTAFALAAPAPNPTAGTARVAFALPTEAAVSVVVYDALGRRVATLAEGQMAAGRHEARLDAGALAPGVYVVRMTAGTFAATQRLTVVR